MPPRGQTSNTADYYIPRPNVVFRNDWGALPAKDETDFLALPVSDLLLTFTGGEECHTDGECEARLLALQKHDMEERGMADIQYNYYIGGNGVVYEGRGWHIRSQKEPTFAHLDGISIDFAFIGDFEEKDPPSPMSLAGTEFLKYLLEQGYIKERFEVTPLAMSRSSADQDGASENPNSQKPVIRYAIFRDPNVMSNERPELPPAPPLTTPYTDSVDMF